MSDSSEALQAHLDAARGAGAQDTGHFTIDPGRWVAVLASMAQNDPLLWAKNLCQWHSRTRQTQPLRLRRSARGYYRLDLMVAPEDVAHFGPRAVAGYASRPGEDSAAKTLARILALMPPGSSYGSLRDGIVSREAQHLAYQPGGAEGDGAPANELWFELKDSTLRTARLFGVPLTNARDAFQPFAATMRVALEAEDQPPMKPDWPTPETADSETTLLWDWESVEPDLDGFGWSIPAWGVPFDQTSAGWEILSHPVRLKRLASEMPLLGCYPSGLAQELLAKELRPDTPYHRLLAGRVFGVSWNISSPETSRCYPVIDGIIGQALDLPELPSGLFLLARADHLATDASGTSLVRDHNQEQWLREQASWMKDQVRSYLPCMGSVSTLWAQRVSRLSQLHQRKSWLRAALEKGAARMYSSGPLQGVLAKRREALLRWVESAAKG